MAKRQFTDAERYAVYTVHHEKCYMCSKPLDLVSMEVDHVVPESLLDRPIELQQALRALGLAPDFDVQSFSNWMPSCGPCNILKTNAVFSPSPLVQVILEKASKKASQAAALAAETVSSQKFSRSWNAIKRALIAGTVGENLKSEILEFFTLHASNRTPDVAAEPIRLSPRLTIIRESNGIRIVKGPYGAGGGPIGPNIHSSFYCPNCGSNAWNGARCVNCGMMDDD